MAFTKSLGGDRWRIHHGSVVPKKFSASYTAPAPAVGHLVKIDSVAAGGAGVNDGVLQCAAGDPPYGMVLSVNSGNNTLSVLRFAKIQSVVLEYQTAPAIGDKIACHGSAGTVAVDGVLRDRIISDNTDGVGTVVALNEPVTNLCVVEFPAEAQGT